MIPLNELVRYSDQYLDAASFRDYCPNGLQVEGRGEVRRLVSGVTASLALIEAAIEADADALLVHHGYFWKGEDARVTGMKQRRLSMLLRHDISLLAYHLPLDAHETVGNNAQLARHLGLTVQGRSGEPGGPQLLFLGAPETPLTAVAFGAHIENRLGRRPQHIPGSATRIERLAWCTGAAQGYIEQAVAQGVDAFMSGEISEPTVHVARECGIHYFAAGHHATERYGVQALGAHLAERFGLEHRFIEIENPV
jgi:dinuclear metal center YbgI/SA1388 family protein